MVGVAQVVEHRVVAPVAAGSSPVAHPNYLEQYIKEEVVLLSISDVFLFVCARSSVDRAPDFESVGRRFESCRARHFFRYNL